MIANRTLRVLIAAAASVPLFGCTDLIVSDRVAPCPQGACSAPAGFVYSLPRGQMLLQASRKRVTQQDLMPAASAVAAASEPVKKDEAAVNEARQKLALDKSKNA